MAAAHPFTPGTLVRVLSADADRKLVGQIGLVTRTNRFYVHVIFPDRERESAFFADIDANQYLEVYA